MRLRIVKRMRGEVDGVSLEQFRVGETYDVGTSLGSYLLALRAAVPVADVVSKSAPPVDSTKDRTKAADGPRSKRKSRRKPR